MVHDIDSLTKMIRPAVETFDFELLGCEFIEGGHDSIFRVYIDSSQGISLDDCATVSEQLGAILDVEDPIPGSYNLEVSSPGLDRPLFIPEHYTRQIGQTIKVRLRGMGSGKKSRITGLLRAVDSGSITLIVNGAERTIGFDEIIRSNLVPSI